jgi:phenylpropionate dioxygenase-like ring-hydroxylating dioxygenase large terminal subunit
MATTPTKGLDPNLGDGTPIGDLIDGPGAHISRRIYGNDEIFDLERDRIFQRAWGFLGHVSELPNPGDYIARDLAGEPVAVIRGDDGEIRAFLNSCRHRGMRVCRADKDNVSYMRCVYHGWTYNREGGLVSAFAEELYDPGRLKKEELGLIPVAHLAIYRGLIFATWNEDAPPFEEYLGDMAFYLDMFLGRTDEGTEVVGAPQVWDVHTDWKFAADNFTGDNFHLYTAHGSVVDLGMLPPDPMSLSYGYLVRAQGGHVLHMVPGPPDPAFEYFGLPRELVPQFERNLDPVQLDFVKNHGWSVGTIFPNLSFMQVLVQGEIGGPNITFLSLRAWMPTGSNSTRVHSWLLVDKDSPQEFRDQTHRAYVHTFGPSGIFEQDDMENWEDCTRVNRGKVAQRYGLHHGMGLHLEPDPTFAGPGEAWPGSYGERTQLAFYGEWRRWMTEDRPWEAAR